MAAFSSLTDRLSNAFKHLKSKGKLSEADIDGTIREIRRALLDADVALDVVRSFTGRIRERALGTAVSEALNPAQQVGKIVNEELTAVLGAGVDRPLNFAKNPPTIIMLAGLQGAGKTTLAGKLGYWLKDSGHTPLLVAADLQRPNAVARVEVVGERAGVPVDAPGKGVQSDGGEAVVSPGQTTGDPVKVARALEDLTLESVVGPVRMRGEDHQLLLPQVVNTIAPVDGKAVKVGWEGTNYGFRTDAAYTGNELAQGTDCKMTRP